MVLTRMQNNWRVCIDYSKLNLATCKNHFPLPFIDQVLEKLAGMFHYCFLDGYSGYMQICIAPKDQHKTTFPLKELGHLVSNRGNDVDKAKVDVITSLPNPASVWHVRSFLGHVGFYRKIALPLSKLLQKDVDFVFDEACIEAFNKLKTRLTSAPILQAPNWELPFELMCDASNLALGAILSQQVGVGKPAHVIAYATQTMDPTQVNYTTMEKELLAIVFSLVNFCTYLLGSKVIVFSNHAALKYLLKKLDAKLRLIRWMLLLHEFNLQIKDKKGAKNTVADHLSHILG
ncbi:Retrovirus-related Pol polyprotein, partial [Mucuna pruriens]